MDPDPRGPKKWGLADLHPAPYPDPKTEGNYLGNYLYYRIRDVMIYEHKPLEDRCRKTRRNGYYILSTMLRELQK